MSTCSRWWRSMACGSTPSSSRIIFCETGLVVTPFLPGDSLLFVAGAIAATGDLDVNLLFALLASAAFLGNLANYAIGRWLGAALLHRPWLALAQSRALAQGPRVLRTPRRRGRDHLALHADHPHLRSVRRGALGAWTRANSRSSTRWARSLWVGGLAYAGYFFGNIPWVRGNLTAIIIGIVVVSLLPLAWALLKKPRKG